MKQEIVEMHQVIKSLLAELSTAWMIREAAHAGGGTQPRPGTDEPMPVPGREPPIKEPEPDRLPDETPNPNPDENKQPPIRTGGERARAGSMKIAWCSWSG